MARRIPALPDEWGDLFTCVLLHMLLPLLPLLIEAWMKGSPTESTAAITASMYSIAIGLSSRNKAMLGFCITISIIFSVVFGVVSASQASQLNDVKFYSGLSIFFVFLIHIFERYNRHVVDCIPFWDFSKGEV
ncbi:hypothetical protein MQC82_18465 [Pseudomonas viridiflava]|uniref:hypothetical protein n=1 Tax=Pseudomonas viridiflava TaxID=33069 RepID=UPI001C31528A|nr:hypothetical protein [Pseudomonas viridiflava]MCI3911534.1 hypothetical protein [Pseudomonas viridiflava]QXG25585.1 hypothetical protein KTT56_01620 [Pseudomonas viridiflava]